MHRAGKYAAYTDGVTLPGNGEHGVGHGGTGTGVGEGTGRKEGIFCPHTVDRRWGKQGRGGGLWDISGHGALYRLKPPGAEALAARGIEKPLGCAGWMLPGETCDGTRSAGG